MSVFRCYSQKRPGFDVEAQGLCAQLRAQLGISALKSVVILNRYDADQLDRATRAAVIKAFCSTVQNAGYQAGVYSGEYFYNENIDFSTISPYMIWLASYTRNNNLPGYANRYDMWQFTDSGPVRGIEGGVDMNVIF